MLSSILFSLILPLHSYLYCCVLNFALIIFSLVFLTFLWNETATKIIDVFHEIIFHSIFFLYQIDFFFYGIMMSLIFVSHEL